MSFLMFAYRVNSLAFLSQNLSPEIWQILSEEKASQDHHKIRNKIWPKKFNDWAKRNGRNQRGWTLAHEAARFGLLPDDFEISGE